MFNENALVVWLVYSAVAATLFLVIGALTVCLRREPVERLRLIQWTLAACLLAPLVNQLPGMPRWSLAWPTTFPQPIEQVNGAVDDQVNSPPVVRDAPNSTFKTQDIPQLPPLEQQASEPVNEEFPKLAKPAAPSSIAINALQNTSQPVEPPTISKPLPAVQLVGVPQAPALIDHWMWPRIVLALYAAGVGIMCAWYAIGFLTLAWLNWTARAVPDDVAKLFRSVVADQAALKVRLSMHRRVELPLAFGLLRPTILLPEQMCVVLSLSRRLGEGQAEGADSALRYSLIHEWSHLGRGDVWRWRLSTVVGILFFYQPLFWWLRRQQRLCQDYLADSQAAGQSAAREDYAKFLVNLAHCRLGLPGALALSVGDGRSNLYRRVLMLLENRQPLAQHLRRARALTIAAAAIAIIALASAIRLTAEDAKPSPKPAAQTSAADGKSPSVSATPAEGKSNSVNCTGEVRDALVGKPIAGAKLTIRKLNQPNGAPLQQFTVETNADGKYTIELPTHHAWQETRNQFPNRRITVTLIPIEVEIKRSGYAPLRRFREVELNGTPSADAEDSAPESTGFSVSRPLTDEAKQKSIELFELRPGEEVTGTLQSPDGKPVPGVRIFAHSMVPKNERSIPVRPPSARQTGIRTVPASEDETLTDANGKFRVTMISPGEGMIWITPGNEFAPQARVLYDQRGDLGTIKLERGSKVEGRIVDVDGKPLVGVYVSAYPWATAEPQYSGNVEQQVHRAAETDAQGKFTLGPLAPGEYRLEPQEYFDSHPAKLRHTSQYQRPLPAMFLPQKLTLANDHRTAQVEIRAVPTVTVEGRLYDGNNLRELVSGMQRRNPGREPAPVIEGKIDGLDYRTVMQVNDDGTFRFTVPKGLVDARVNVSPRRNWTSTPPRWRLGPDKPINSEATIILGSLDDSVHGIEIDYAGGSGRMRPFGPDTTTDGGRGTPRGRGGPSNSRPSTDANPTTSERTTPASPNETNANIASEHLTDGTNDEIGTVVTVLDADTGNPVKDAQVSVARLKVEQNGDTTRTEVGSFVTADEGGFPLKSLRSDWITIPNGLGVRFGTETARYEFLVQVKHPNYPTLTQTIVAPTSGMKLGLRHGEEISGTVKRPDGKPAVGVHLVTESESRYTQEARTDSEGRFQMIVPTPGNFGIQIYPQDQGAPQRYQLNDQRGDLGVIQLKAGQNITGRVVDLDGKPLAGIYVRAMGPFTQPREASVLFHRSAMTDAQGNFSFAPLSAGDYRVEPSDSGGDPSTMRLFYPQLEKHPLPGFFAPQKVTLADGEQPKPIVFRPTPTVVIEGEVKVPAVGQSATTGAAQAKGRRGFGANAPTRTTNYETYKPKIVGIVDGLEYAANVTIDSDGKFTAKIPKGATDVQVHLGNRGGPQVRAGKDKPLVDPGAISLGTVNEDVQGVEIVYP
jgi:beta-lactamase regulating signal transducer with metallopeptidase domain/5-hydroxyisourate hydrolase-like protein (transthyretin family)/protocatechuate 3,4-dioxygenase beta subunit